uniref:G-protein coupled receptors family 1 profile domain-containing protein n=1 Tax=Pyxicephalus adspersus TaxID=30357 RepID=A0AAV3AIL7_PYXAD|nr:TPA: hypothetical protein GDO54_013908 [Pyxicephalus adspersus]
MEKNNQSHPGLFFLYGPLHDSPFDILWFHVFTYIYCMSLIGNVAIILIIFLNSSLHIPLYFFLANLAFLDICCISTTVPKMLHNFVMASFTITFSACAVQLFVFSWIEITELLLFSCMAFDRYIAICKPLHYTIIITHKVCVQASIGVWLLGAFSSAVHTSLTFTLSFCNDQEIKNFFCEVPSLLKLSCTDTTLNEIFTLVTDLIAGILCFVCIAVSYCFIIISISRIRSADSKKKAISTCTSHITVVLIYYGTLFIAYVKPRYGFFENQDVILSIIYGIFIPFLNPLIYTFRNRELINALTKLNIKMAK